MQIAMQQFILIEMFQNYFKVGGMYNGKTKKTDIYTGHVSKENNRW